MKDLEGLEASFRELGDFMVHRSMGAFFRFAREHELSPSQLGTLMQLNGHRHRRMSHLGGELFVTSAAASQMVDRLVNAGFVNRREAEDDRRSKFVELTAEGRRLLEDGRGFRHSWIREILPLLDEREASIIKEALDIVVSKLKTLETKEDEREEHRENGER